MMLPRKLVHSVPHQTPNQKRRTGPIAYARSVSKPLSAARIRGRKTGRISLKKSKSEDDNTALGDIVTTAELLRVGARWQWGKV